MNKKILKELFSDLCIILVALVLVFIINTYFFFFAFVDGKSMETTLSKNDFGISFYYDLDNINRFDIVVIDNDHDKLIIKRIIGLPNERIVYKDNKLYINGEYYFEEFLDNSSLTNDFDVELGDDEFFCLGDNRTISKDSRYYGAFNKKQIKSTHFFRFFPFNRIGFVK